MKKSIIFTGGGSAGHVTPNLALIPRLIEKDYDVKYIGSHTGIEKEIIEKHGIDFYGIPAGKLRRYFSWKNFSDIFNVFAGIFQSFFIIRKLKPKVIFSKGGFVSCPVVWSAWLNRIPVIIHESDITPGLANKLSAPFAKRICITFPEASKYVSSEKQILSGLPLRDFIFQGDADKGRKFCGFSADKSVIMVIGGSLGASKINEAVREALPELASDFQIVHLCGKGKTDSNLEQAGVYKQFEYISDEMADIYAMADIIISRAGSTSINEIRALKKLNILIPLPLSSSRGDQILNAQSFEEQGISKVLLEEDLSAQSLLDTIKEVKQNEEMYKKNMEKTSKGEAVNIILEEIKKLSGA